MKPATLTSNASQIIVLLSKFKKLIKLASFLKETMNFLIGENNIGKTNILALKLVL